MRCWSHRRTTSVAQEGGTTTGSTWTGDGRRRQAGPLVGLRRLYTCTLGRSGMISWHPEQQVCSPAVTSEPFSSWTAAGASSGLRLYSTNSLHRLIEQYSFSRTQEKSCHFFFSYVSTQVVAFLPRQVVARYGTDDHDTLLSEQKQNAARILYEG